MFLQTFRRDSQDEIYAGSHRYPGQVNNIFQKHLNICKYLYHICDADTSEI